MKALRLAAGAAVTAVVAWGLKAVAIAVAGGLDKSPLESPLFVLGLVAIVVAFVALGAAATGGRALSIRVLGGAGGVLVGLALFLAVETAVGAAVPESAGWVQEEAGLWAGSLLTAVLTLAWLRSWGRQRSTRRPGKA